jgi:diguanylate cyclase (GGDEF)-like protein
MRLFERRPSRLDVFMVATVVCAAPVTASAVRGVMPVPRGVQLAFVVVLAAGVVLGELFPIEIARNGRHSDEITVSTTLALALVLVAPLGWALLAQSVPLVIDDLRRRKHWSRPVFNVAQYALTFAAAKAVFCALEATAGSAPGALAARDLPAVFAAAAAYFLVNQMLVGTAVALWTGEKLLSQVREDGLFHFGTSGLLVCLAPVVVAVAQFSLVLAPLLVLPLVAVRNSARMAMQRQHDALHDALTGLPNRAFLRDELVRRLNHWQDSGVGGHQGLAVLLLDIDHFKEINDTLGHLAGDQLIREVGTRLLDATAADQVDGSRVPVALAPMVARLGGDEFAILTALDGAQRTWATQVTDLAATIGAHLGQTVVLADVRLAVQASIGIAIAPWHGTTVDDLLAKADVAMYAAKKQHHGWALYDASQDSNSPERLALLGELRDGIEQGQLLVAYQPKCDARTRRLHSVEALVRWQHPVRGLLAPAHFIDVAESTGIITQLTLAVLDEAVRQARVWLDAGRPIPVAVNLSARLLTDLQLPATVEAILRDHGLPSHLLTLEVTESTIMNDPTRATAICAALRALGVRLAIDDYGTGYSSLSYLCQLQADELKIDKSFVSKLTSRTPSGSEAGDQGASVIVRSTIDLGRSLGMSVVAEGVEDDETWQLLTGLGCDLIQGYALTPPLVAAAFDAWLERWDRKLSASDGTLPPAPRRPVAVPTC